MDPQYFNLAGSVSELHTIVVSNFNASVSIVQNKARTMTSLHYKVLPVHFQTMVDWHDSSKECSCEFVLGLNYSPEASLAYAHSTLLLKGLATKPTVEMMRRFCATSIFHNYMRQPICHSISKPIFSMQRMYVQDQ